MSLSELKLKPFESLAQAVIFDSKGSVIESDNTLFELPNGNIYTDIDLFMGMEHLISEVKAGAPLDFRCVNLTIAGYESHFDFIIQKLDDNFCLLIYDFGEQYQKVFELQQERNVSDIATKKLQKDKKKILEEKEAINRLYQNLTQSGTSQYVLLKSDNLLVNVDLNSVLYFEAYGDYIKVHTENKVFIIYNRMKNVESQLPEGKFYRVHRSYIVPLDKIENIEQMSLSVAGKILPIGKHNKQGLLNSMKQL